MPELDVIRPLLRLVTDPPSFRVHAHDRAADAPGVGQIDGTVPMDSEFAGGDGRAGVIHHRANHPWRAPQVNALLSAGDQGTGPGIRDGAPACHVYARFQC